MSEEKPLHLFLNDIPPGTGPQVRGNRDLMRIGTSLQAAQELLAQFAQGKQPVDLKADGQPVTPADRAADALLKRMLPREDEGWLSEETPDNLARLEKRRVWVVDPLDGTKEFQLGIPQWCVSIGLIENQCPVAGGISNPATGEVFLGSSEMGILSFPSSIKQLQPDHENLPVVLASRSEVERGEWDYVQRAPFKVRSVGSIAYKLALVASGRADATWTLVPKNEWDIAGGVALVLASGGQVLRPSGKPLVFNQPNPRWEGIIAFSGTAQQETIQLFKDWLSLPK